jgi:hypothetical protein
MESEFQQRFKAVQQVQMFVQPFFVRLWRVLSRPPDTASILSPLSVDSSQEGFSAIMTFEVPIGQYIVYNIVLTSQNLMKKDKRKILTRQQLIRLTKILDSSKSGRSVSRPLYSLPSGPTSYSYNG